MDRVQFDSHEELGRQYARYVTGARAYEAIQHDAVLLTGSRIITGCDFMNTEKATPVTWKRIADDIYAYTKLRGCKPYALILHPRHLLALGLGAYGRLELLKNVRILTSSLFDEPVLANGKGDPFDV